MRTPQQKFEYYHGEVMSWAEFKRRWSAKEYQYLTTELGRSKRQIYRYGADVMREKKDVQPPTAHHNA